MEDVFDAYFKKLIAKLDETAINSIQIVSRDGRVLVKSHADMPDISVEIVRSIMGELDIKDSQKILYNNSGEYTILGTPLMVEEQLMGIVLMEAINLKKGEQIAAILRTSLETYMEHYNALQEKANGTNRDEVIIKELLRTRRYDLEEKVIPYKLFKTLKKFDFDLFLFRAVILIELEKKTNTYFNINLDLGYESSLENFKDKVVAVIKGNKYLNNQDVVAFFDNNHIVLLKSFLNVGNAGKLYYALDNICKGLVSDLDEAKIFAYRIAYGGIYSDLFDVKRSYAEAENTIRLGAVFQESPGVYTADGGLLEHVGYYLPQIIKDKAVQMVLTRLKRADGSTDYDLLSIAEEFVNQCMNLMRTANALHLHRNTVSVKMEKFRNKTGLDPEKNFNDAFLIKITALLVKMEALSPGGMK